MYSRERKGSRRGLAWSKHSTKMVRRREKRVEFISRWQTASISASNRHKKKPRAKPPSYGSTWDKHPILSVSSHLISFIHIYHPFTSLQFNSIQSLSFYLSFQCYICRPSYSLSPVTLNFLFLSQNMTPWNVWVTIGALCFF